MISKEQRRSDILNAALEVFSIKGFDRSTIAEIAEAAGIGKGTVYEYFQSKKELFEDMIRYNVESYNRKLQASVKKGSTVEEKLISFSMAHSEFMGGHVELLKLFPQKNMMSEKMRCFIVQEKRKIFKFIEELIEEGIENGTFKKTLNKETTALCIIGGINEHYFNKVFMNKIHPEELQHGAFVKTLVEGFR